MIKILPAIDLYDGKVVRLKKGSFDEMTVYGTDPVSYANDLYEAGARFIHIVDLEGAKIGKPVHIDVLHKIATQVPVKIQYGGGLRSAIYIEDALEAGAARAIVSTRALTDEEFLKIVSQSFTDRITISIDVKDGYVFAKGWQEKAMPLEDALNLISTYSFPHLIFTDIERDGTNEGVNLDLVEYLLKKSPVPAIVAGGISSLNDIEHLAKYETIGLEGIIIGKAHYEGLIDLKRVFNLFPQEDDF
ncbi:MAG: 1-(5-phosphoribosyl)-5-[(5-phosphoribosylamino)methylideneamino]imidazole-4-carboxamide isomerase [Actinobacteria bacterium]|nr:1-(5-phosphoribosyl)-5-[(5-phosphoribosylamino)methylideneamino]imidazole-4-carboxamide isomerase [Actinomycetota bacterium]